MMNIVITTTTNLTDAFQANKLRYKIETCHFPIQIAALIDISVPKIVPTKSSNST